jgi:hypothetical protein
MALNERRDMKLIPKKWDEFQHYRDRKPPWIKLHRWLLDDRDFMCLPVASRALAPCLWLLASEQQDGSFDGSVESLAFRLRLPQKEIEAGLRPLIEKGFFLDAITMLAPCLQDATSERETERETENREQRQRTETERCASVFGHWQSVHGHSSAKLTADRRKVVVKALQNYSPDELCECISGYKASAWHQGQNERGQVYDALELMLRDAKHIDAGISYARKPAQGRTVADLREAATKNTIEEWANG